MSRLSFVLPPELEAGSPAEARGLTRDAVRMMVAYRSDRRIVHSTFALLATFLEPADLLVINTSGTLPAAVGGVDPAGGKEVVLHFSTHLQGPLWVVEPRMPTGGATRRWRAEQDGSPPRRVVLGEDGSSLQLMEPYRGSSRLWMGLLLLPTPALSWLAVHGTPIRYEYADRPWPLAAYQNVYATEPGARRCRAPVDRSHPRSSPGSSPRAWG